MPAKRKAMRKIKDVLRLKFEAGLSHEQIAAACKLSKGAVSKYTTLATSAGIGWPLPPGMEDAELEARLFPPAPARSRYVMPEFAYIHQELKRKGVTLWLLWEEYVLQHPAGAYRYTQFCHHYEHFRESLKRSMRQTHRAGEKLFIDYCGQTVPIIDAASGEICCAQIFVAVLGASHYVYAEATWTQQLPDWIGSHVRTFEHLRSVPSLLVPDNLKSAIKRACRYEPEANSTYQEMACHYGSAILPARPAHPRDKAVAENGVLLVSRWILARLRNRQFFSLGELNAALRELLIELNQRPFKKLDGCRASAFESIDRPAMKPLPPTRYEYAEWKFATVGIDYHVEVYGHYYSVPQQLVRQKIEVRITATTIECFFKAKRLAAHARSSKRGAHSTIAEHMPEAHRKHLQWTPGRLLTWALAIGPGTRDVVKWQLEHRPHPEQGYRSCLGLLQLCRRYSEARLEAACRRALTIGSPTGKSVKSILETNLDQHPELFPEPSAGGDPHRPLPHHSNLRGADYFQQGEIGPCSCNPPSIH